MAQTLEQKFTIFKGAVTEIEKHKGSGMLDSFISEFQVLWDLPVVLGKTGDEIVLWDLPVVLGKTGDEIVNKIGPDFLNLLSKQGVHQPLAGPLRRVVSVAVAELCGRDRNRMSTIQNLLRSFSSMLTSKAPGSVKVSVMECIRVIYLRHGGEAVHSLSIVVEALLDRTKSGDIQQREGALRTLRDIVIGIGEMVNSSFNEVFKAIKNGLGDDKSKRVQRAAALLFGELMRFVPQNRSEDMLEFSMKEVNEADRRLCSNLIGIGFGTLLSKLVTFSEEKILKEKRGQSDAAASGGGSGSNETIVWSSSKVSLLCKSLFCKSGISNETRWTVSVAFSVFLKNMKVEQIQTNMRSLVDNLLGHIIDHKPYSSLDQIKFACHSVANILQNSLRKRVGESGLKVLLSTYTSVLAPVLKANPKSKQHVPRNEFLIVVTLRELSIVFQELGGGVQNLSKAIEQLLVGLIAHSSSAVRRSAAVCLRSFAVALPEVSASMIKSLLDSIYASTEEVKKVKSDMEKSKRLYSQIQGQSLGVAALLAAVRRSSFGLSSSLLEKAFRLSKTLLSLGQPQKGRDPNFIVSMCESGWSILGPILCLDAVFVEEKLADILSLWHTAFSSITVPKAEKALLLFNKTMAPPVLALKSLVDHNLQLLQYPKVLPAVITWLKNLFAACAPFTEKQQLQFPANIMEGITLLRVHIITILGKLPPPKYASMFVSILKLVAAQFVEGRRTSLSGKNLDADDDMLQDDIGDDSVSSLYVGGVGQGYSGPKLKKFPTNKTKKIEEEDMQDLEYRETGALIINDSSWIWNAEHDSLFSWSYKHQPASVQLVDALQEIFPLLFMYQSTGNQMNLLKHFLSCKNLNAPSEQKHTMQANIVTAVCRLCTHLQSNRTTFASEEMLTICQKIVQDNLATVRGDDVSLCRCAAETLGLLPLLYPMGSSGTDKRDQYTGHLISSLIATIGQNQNSAVRSGCALALGSIHRSLGTLRSSPHVPTTISTLKDLANTMESSSSSSSSLAAVSKLRLYALHSLWLAIREAGPAIASQRKQILSLMYSLLLRPTYTDWSPNLISIGRIVNALISAIGPELNPFDETMKRCEGLRSELECSPNVMARVEAVKFIQMLSVFAPQTVPVEKEMIGLYKRVGDHHKPLRQAAILCLRQLVQLNPYLFLGADWHRDVIVALFLHYEVEKHADIRRDIETSFYNIVDAVAVSVQDGGGKGAGFKVGHWIQLWKQIITTSGTSSKQQEQQKVVEEKKEKEEEEENEGAGLAGAPEPETTDDKFIITRDTTRSLALECTIKLVNELPEKSEHFHLPKARRARVADSNKDFLVFHLRDVFALAYSATTSSSPQLQKQGVLLLRVLIDRFRNCPDPVYDDELEDEEKNSSSLSGLGAKHAIWKKTHALESKGLQNPTKCRLHPDVFSVTEEVSEDPSEAPPCVLDQYQAQITAALRHTFRDSASPTLTEVACPVLVSYLLSGASIDSVKKVLEPLTSRLSSIRNLRYEQYSDRPAVEVRRAVVVSAAAIHVNSMCTCDKTSSLGKSVKYIAIREIFDELMVKVREDWRTALMDFAVMQTQSRNVQKSWRGSFYTFATHTKDSDIDSVAQLLLALSTSEKNGDSYGPADQSDVDLIIGLSLSTLSTLSENSEVNRRCLLSLSYLLPFADPLPLYVIQEIAVCMAVLVRQVPTLEKTMILALLPSLSRHLEACLEGSERGKAIETWNVIIETAVFPLFSIFPQIREKREGKAGSSSVGGMKRTPTPLQNFLLEASLFSLSSLHANTSPELKETTLPVVLVLFGDVLEELKDPNFIATFPKFLSYLDHAVSLEEGKRWEGVGNIIFNGLSTYMRSRDPAQIDFTFVWTIGVLFRAGHKGDRGMQYELYDLVRQANTQPTTVSRSVMMFASALESKAPSLSKLTVLRLINGLAEEKIEENSVQKNLQSSLFSFLGPCVVTMLKNHSSKNFTGDEAEVALACVSEGIRYLLLSHQITSDPSLKLKVLLVVIPSLISLLVGGGGGRSGGYSAKVKQASLSVLLSLAQTIPDEFKAVLGALPSTEKTTVEEAFRAHLTGASSSQNAGDEEDDGSSGRRRRRRFQEEEELSIDLDAF